MESSCKLNPRTSQSLPPLSSVLSSVLGEGSGTDRDQYRPNVSFGVLSPFPHTPVQRWSNFPSKPVSPAISQPHSYNGINDVENGHFGGHPMVSNGMRMYQYKTDVHKSTKLHGQSVVPVLSVPQSREPQSHHHQHHNNNNQHNFYKPSSSNPPSLAHSASSMSEQYKPRGGHNSEESTYEVKYGAFLFYPSSVNVDKDQAALIPNPRSIYKRKYATSMDERSFVTVYEYSINHNVLIWDYHTGYVHMTGIWKALGNSKADTVKLIDSAPGLASFLKRARGGFLKVQGTWAPYKLAKMLAIRTAYKIRYALVPIFGPEFPAMCLKPTDPEFGHLDMEWEGPSASPLIKKEVIIEPPPLVSKLSQALKQRRPSDSRRRSSVEPQTRGRSHSMISKATPSFKAPSAQHRRSVVLKPGSDDYELAISSDDDALDVKHSSAFPPAVPQAPRSFETHESGFERKAQAERLKMLAAETLQQLSHT